jgi:hypothetical protein
LLLRATFWFAGSDGKFLRDELRPKRCSTQATIGSRSGFKAYVDGALRNSEEKEMLWTIFVIFLVLWLVGLVSSYTFGGLIHILLVIAVVALIIQLVSGRRAAL